MSHTPNVTRAELTALVEGTPPFTSVYMDMDPSNRDTLIARLAAIADGLRALGAGTDEIERVTTPFIAPPDDRSAMAVITSHDGRTLVSSSPEPLHRDLAEFGVVPRLGPIIEWSQQMVTHAVVRPDPEGRLDMVVFDADGSVVPYSAESADPRQALSMLAPHRPAAVFLTGFGESREGETLGAELRDAVLRQELPADCMLEPLESDDPDEIAATVVRHTASVIATRKVEMLQQFRFERSHGNAVEGIAAVVDAANEGAIATLLLHTDPDDKRWVALQPDGTILVPADDTAALPDDPVRVARVVDALITLTLRTGGAPVIVPHTGERGPDDDIGALLRPLPAVGLIDR